MTEAQLQRKFKRIKIESRRDWLLRAWQQGFITRTELEALRAK